MIVPESAQDKMIPQSVMGQLDFGAEPNVPGEQTENGRPRMRSKLRNHPRDAWQHSSECGLEHMVEPENVALEEAAEVGLGRFDTVAAKKLSHNRGIGPPCETQTGRAIGAWNSVAQTL